MPQSRATSASAVSDDAVGRAACAAVADGVPAGSRRDSGNTLIEILVTIVLIATAVAAILAGVQANIIASSQSRAAARVESVVVNIADRINRAPNACDYTVYAQAAAVTEKWPASAVTLVQQHYKYTKYDPNASVAGSWLSGGCDSELSTPPDLQVQRILIKVTSPDGRATRQIEVVKSDV